MWIILKLKTTNVEERKNILSNLNIKADDNLN